MNTHSLSCNRTNKGAGPTAGPDAAATDAARVELHDAIDRLAARMKQKVDAKLAVRGNSFPAMSDSDLYIRTCEEMAELADALPRICAGKFLGNHDGDDIDHLAIVFECADAANFLAQIAYRHEVGTQRTERTERTGQAE